MNADEVDAITALVASFPPQKQVDFVLGMLEKVADERDRLRAELGEARASAWGGIKFRARLAGQLSRAQADQGRLRTVVEAAIRHVEQEQFRGNDSDQLSALYRILNDESIAPEPETLKAGEPMEDWEQFVSEKALRDAGKVIWLEARVRQLEAGDRADAHDLTMSGHYFSTYCLHEHHETCRLTCKVCGALCRCTCHESQVNTEKDT